MPEKASKLINDLRSVPSIVGALGINIAEAQKALNADYLDNLEVVLAISQSLFHPKEEQGNKDVPLSEENRKAVTDLVTQLAPSRYQFTETHLTVKLDLAQTLDVGAEGAFTAGIGAVAVSAAMTVGFGYDYRAAAEVKTVLHAIPANAQTLSTLLSRAATVNDKVLTLPPSKDSDTALIDKSHEIVGKLVGAEKLKKPEEKAEPKKPD